MDTSIPQLATIRITCNGDTGTAVIFFPSEDAEYVYIFTAKHCLTGKKFDKEFTKEDILLDQILNSNDGVYHSYRLVNTDVVVTSNDSQDLALLILPKQQFIELTGRPFFYQIIDTNHTIVDYIIRGFASFNDQEADRPFPVTFVENQKSNNDHFILKSDQQMDTYYQQALENVEGLSGGGAFVALNNNIYLVGIVHFYENGNLFTATKALCVNHLIPKGKFATIGIVRPELRQVVLSSFIEIGKNLELAKSRTKDTVGTINIPRDGDRLIQVIKESRMTVIHGKPGVGKSALAKAAVTGLKTYGSTIIFFSAEQLYAQSLSVALSKAGYSASLEQIVSSPLAGNRILIWIESFEKLIESGYEGAFNELLEAIKKLPQLAVVVTVRDYLLQKFKITYRYELPEQMEFYPVSEFNDDEIAKIREGLPELQPLLDNEKIYHLLRTPYYLDKAARIVPQLLNESQLDDSAFKRLMWQHIIEVGDSQRGITFSSVCLKRAREMSLFTRSEEPKTVIGELVRDNLLQIENNETADKYSPSHDILEDWALVRFIKQQYEESNDPKTFIGKLETSPAIRRAFRLWLDEFYRQEPEISASIVHTLLLDQDLKYTWKDELIIASLRSNHATILIYALKPMLLANDGAFLRRVIRLLETGCRTVDPRSRNFEQWLPVGSGWDAVITFMRDNFEIIESFGSFETQHLSVIEGWSKQLPDFGVRALPSSASDAAFLLMSYIQKNSDKVSGGRRRRVDNSYLKTLVSILFKLTGAMPDAVRELIFAARDLGNMNEKWANRELLKAVRSYMIDGVMSDQLCKYFPDAVLDIAKQEWLMKPKGGRAHSHSFMLDSQPNIEDFGLDEHIGGRYTFPSGYQTFFYWMFLHHSDRALDFLIPFLNDAFQKNQEVLVSHRGRKEEITVRFLDGQSQIYFANNEYWGMYRGTHTRNTLIASLLMGLEGAILNMADQGEAQYQHVKPYLKRLLEESNNVSTLGVVVSVLEAHPALLDEVSVPLFGVRSFFEWDISRSNSELTLYGSYIDDPFQKAERIKSNQRLHRKRHYLGMVGFVAEYMFYYRTHNELLFQQIDAMWAVATEEDQLWRKFLFDMDARKYNFKPIEAPGYENMVQLVPGYDAQVQEAILSRNDQPSLVPVGNSLWAKKAFNNEPMLDKTYEVWKSGYQYLRSPHGEDLFMMAPGTMAAVGLRDFYLEMEPEEIVWCREELMRQGERRLLPDDGYSIAFDILDEPSTMIGVSFVFKGDPEASVQNRAKEIIFRLLIHNMEQRAKSNLEAGISFHLFQDQPLFVTNMWYGLLKLLDFKRAEIIADESLYYYDTDDEAEPISSEQRDAEFKAWKEQLVKSIIDGSITPPDHIEIKLDSLTKWYQDDALRIIPYVTQLDAHHEFIQQLLKLHYDFLNDPKQRDQYKYHDSRYTFSFFYARYLLNQPRERSQVLFKELLDMTLIIDGSDETSKVGVFLYDLVKEHIRGVNDGAPVTNFWLLWEILRNWMIEHKRALLFPLFLMDLEWSEESDGWHVLDGKNLYYKEFILEYGFNQINTSIKFLSGIAFNKFMPDSINWFASMLGSSNAHQIDLRIGGKFVEKAFYKYGSRIKGDKNLLNKFLLILDFLILKGSPKAYILKEELIQYTEKS